MIATPVFPDLAALVADESLYMRRILRDMLTRVGIKRVLEAPDGAEALGVLSESKPTSSSSTGTSPSSPGRSSSGSRARRPPRRPRRCRSS
jgi:hypothetical protein